MKRAWFIPILLALISSTQLFAEMIDGELTIDNTKRTFHFYSPDNLPADKTYPLVIVLHGGKGMGQNMVRFTKFDDLADRDSFLVVYPDGWKRQWNDHRTGEDLPFEKDDVKFLSSLIDYLVQKHHADSTRVFVTGISNGAIMSLFLVQEIPQKIRAIAAVCGSIPENYFSTYHISKPISVLMINGTQDPLIHYEGGPVGKSGWERGATTSVDSAVQKILAINQCSKRDSVFRFPDINIKDDCTAEKMIWKCGENNVEFIKIKGGGHTWPGGLQYLPKYMIGTVCKDFNATSEIWNFFSSQIIRSELKQ